MSGIVLCYQRSIQSCHLGVNHLQINGEVGGRGIKIVEETVCTKNMQDKIVCNNILMLDQKFIIEDMMPTFL